VHESRRELEPWMPWCHAGYELSETRAWLEFQVLAFTDRREFQFAIEDSTGRFLGGCGLNALDGANRRANLGYWVRTSEAGHGVATEATRLLRAWAFEHTELIRLEIVVAVANRGSVRVAEKAGAEREGVLRRRLVLQGAAHDAAIFAFTRALPMRPLGGSASG